MLEYSTPPTIDFVVPSSIKVKAFVLLAVTVAVSEPNVPVIELFESFIIVNFLFIFCAFEIVTWLFK